MTTRRSAPRLVFGILVALVSSSLLLVPPSAQEKVAKKFSKRADASLAARKQQVQQELESLKVEE